LPEFVGLIGVKQAAINGIGTSIASIGTKRKQLGPFKIFTWIPELQPYCARKL
jgi:hypothetical protein